MKIEMHAHTSEASPCANVSAAKIPALYQKAGYDAIVITDHYCKWAQDRSGLTNNDDYVQYFLNGYRSARKAAEQIGFTVLLGAEANLPGSPNDYLLYGITEEFILAHPDIHEMSLPELYKLCHDNDILLLQAHPYRTYCNPADPQYLDGAESYNGNPRHDNRNELAREWTDEYHMIESSGSDFHELEDVAQGGIKTAETILDTRQLRDVLLSGQYQLLTP